MLRSAHSRALVTSSRMLCADACSRLRWQVGSPRYAQVVSTTSRNASLSTAKENKEDEFYTQLSDIEREVKHYWKHFEGKTVYLNCDDPRVSNFFHYFSYNFEKLGLKKLIATCYKNEPPQV